MCAQEGEKVALGDSRCLVCGDAAPDHDGLLTRQPCRRAGGGDAAPGERKQRQRQHHFVSHGARDVDLF